MADKHTMETIIKLAGAVDPSLGKSAKEASKALGGMNLKAVGMKVAFAGAAVIAVKALVDITKGLYDLGKQFDEAYDAIRIGTGATGEELEGLKNDFKDVYSSVPTTMEDAGKAIADYNTRLGLTGDELKELSKQAIAVSGMLDEDLNTTIEASSQAFQQWGISSADMGKSMDYVFKVSQQTGMGFNALMQSMKTVGPQMQQLGFSFEQSAAMMGQMEKAGLNTDEVLKAMKKSVGVFAKEGLNASDGFKTYYEAIKNARTETEAIGLASEVFGQRAGSTMASAIRSGAMAIDDFTASMNASDESIMKAMWDTADAPEKLQILQQRFQTMIEPLASSLFDVVGDLMPLFFDILEQLRPSIEELIQASVPLIQELLPILGDVLKELLPPLVEILLAILPALVEILKALAPVIKFLAEVISISLGNAIELIIPIFQSLVNILTNLINFIVNIFTGKWKDAWHNIVEIVKNLFKGIMDIVLLPFKAVQAGIEKFKGKFGGGKKGKDAEVPALAAGGFTKGISIAGEAGTEAVISFDPAYRANNISTWLKAGELLGVGSGSSNSYSLGGFTLSPTFIVKGDVSPEEIVNKLKSCEGEFMDVIDDFIERKTSGNYSSMTPSY